MSLIKNIEISNFKSIRHQRIEDCRKVNVLIGYPNVGKSNILEALSLFSIDDPEVSFPSLIRMERPTTLFFDGNVGAPLDIVLNGQYLATGLYSKVSGTIDFSIGNPNINVIESSYELRDKKITNWRKPLEQGTPFDFFPVKKYEFKKDVGYKKADYKNLLCPYGENIFNVLYNNEDLIKEASELFKDYSLQLIYDSREENFIILKKQRKEVYGFTIPYDLIADTVRRLIFYKTAIKTNNKSVLLFEEPEAHLFPPYMRIFTTDILYDKSNQFFLTTHSPYILESLMQDLGDDLGIFLVYYEENETRLKKMSNNEMEEIKEYGIDLFYNLESYLKHGQVNNA